MLRSINQRLCIVEINNCFSSTIEIVLRNCKYALWGFEANINVDEIKIRF